MKSMVSVILITMILGGPAACWAKRVHIKNTHRLIMPVDNVTPKITSKDVEKVLPPEVARRSHSGNIMSKIADRGFNLWLNSPAVKESFLGRTVERTQETLKTDVVIAEKPEEGNENAIQHKFSFRVDAFQASAKIEYSGWVKAAVNYDARSSETDIQLQETLFDDKSFVVSHRKSSEEALSMVGLGWHF